VRAPFLTAAVLAALAASPAVAQAPGKQEAQSFSKQIVRTVGLKYLAYVPNDYDKDPGRKWPLILFLHGAGERGSDVEKVKVHGPPKLVAQGKELPFVVISPQCPENQWWSTETLLALLDEVGGKYRIDPDRVYLTGLSMGGFGTWALAAAAPERFAAIAPICGGGDRIQARRLRGMPIWAFHGAKDTVVPLSESERMVEAVKAAGGEARLTVYPEAAHDSWTETYNNPELFEWFLKHRRKSAGQ
jgi:predicted peptidase